MLNYCLYEYSWDILQRNVALKATYSLLLNELFIFLLLHWSLNVFNFKKSKSNVLHEFLSRLLTIRFFFLYNATWTPINEKTDLFCHFQDEAKKKGHPWTLAKGFDTSCPIGDLISKDKLPNPENVQLWLKVNGQTKQDGNTKDMIFNIPFLISYISKYFTLEEGDVILTGTPSGVGPVDKGDVIDAGIGEISSFRFQVE